MKRKPNRSWVREIRLIIKINVKHDKDDSGTFLFGLVEKGFGENEERSRNRMDVSISLAHRTPFKGKLGAGGEEFK